MNASNNRKVIQELEPAAVWSFFADMAAVPRPSKKEGKIRRHILEVAASHRLSAREDAAGNIVIEAPASPGRERAEPVVLQGHLDMVCEKNNDVTHDFDKDGIRFVRDKDDRGEAILRAEGTTLGADNGIGVSLAFAAATSPEVRHGPLELLLTLDEEAGMSGAKALSTSSFRGRRLLNLDSEEDDAIYIGCAGGCDSNLSWTLALQPVDGAGEWSHVCVKGLRGGHSGGDIHEGRGSGIKLLIRTLLGAELNSLRIGEISGGNIRNAIPREAHATVFAPHGSRAALQKVAERVCHEGQSESLEPNLTIKVSEVSKPPTAAISAEDGRRLLFCLAALPHGVLGMHPKVPQLVETSNNVASIAMTPPADGKALLRVANLSRSSTASRLGEVVTQIRALTQLGGGSVETGNEYPGWSPNPDSPTLATARRVYSQLFGEEPHVKAIHAGLECGIIGERVGKMDMISFGPRILGAHSPAERVYIASVQKTWRYLGAVLAELSKP